MFDEVPTAEICPSVFLNEEVGYEHMLAEAGEGDSNQIILELCRRWRTERGAGYYSDLLFVLTNKRYPDDKAHEVWIRVLCHRDHLTAMLGRSPGVVVAALDYLTNVEGSYANASLVDASAKEVGVQETTTPSCEVEARESEREQNVEARGPVHEQNKHAIETTDMGGAQRPSARPTVPVEIPALWSTPTEV